MRKSKRKVYGWFNDDTISKMNSIFERCERAKKKFEETCEKIAKNEPKVKGVYLPVHGDMMTGVFHAIPLRSPRPQFIVPDQGCIFNTSGDKVVLLPLYPEELELVQDAIEDKYTAAIEYNRPHKLEAELLEKINSLVEQVEDKE